MNCLRKSSFSRNYTNIVKKKTYENNNNNNNKTLNLIIESEDLVCDLL
jgi:hypothetical protein